MTLVVGTVVRTGTKVVVHFQGNDADMQALSLFTCRSVTRDNYPRITTTPREAIAICEAFPHIQLEGDIYE